MTKAKQDAFIDQSAVNIMSPFGNEMNLLREKKSSASEQDAVIIEKKINLLYEVMGLIGARVMKLKSKYNPNIRDVQKFYETSLHEIKNLALVLQGDTSLKTSILKTLEKIANFCIKLLTFGNHPHFFSFTPVIPNKNIDQAKDLILQIKSTVKDFINNPEAHQEAENKSNPGSLEM